MSLLPQDPRTPPEATDPGDYDTQGGQAPTAFMPPVPITPPVPEEPLPKAGLPRRPRLLMLSLGLVGILLLGSAVGLFFLNTSFGDWAHRMTGRPEKTVPPALRGYYDRALQGDAGAMRMLGTMYYNGLNVPKDKVEGIHWFRKAAAAGSVAAHKDLEQLGLSPEAH